jgi:hypothetical protein
MLKTNFIVRKYCNRNKHNSMHLTFTGPCIVIYYYNKSQRDALFQNFILFN